MRLLLFLIYYFEYIFFTISVLAIVFVTADFISAETVILFKNVLSFICHQDTEKCFIILNKQISLCSRCIGIYLGFIIFYRFRNYLINFTLLYWISIIYILINLVMEKVFFTELDNINRFIFGMIFSLFIVGITNKIKNSIIKSFKREDVE